MDVFTLSRVLLQFITHHLRRLEAAEVRAALARQWFAAHAAHSFHETANKLELRHNRYLPRFGSGGKAWGDWSWQPRGRRCERVRSKGKAA